MGKLMEKINLAFFNNFTKYIIMMVIASLFIFDFLSEGNKWAAFLTFITLLNLMVLDIIDNLQTETINVLKRRIDILKETCTILQDENTKMVCAVQNHLAALSLPRDCVNDLEESLSFNEVLNDLQNLDKGVDYEDETK